MKTPFQLKSLIAVASAAMFALLAAPIASHQLSGGMFDLVAAAQAAEEGGGSGGKGGEGGKGSKGGAHQGSGGSGSAGHAGSGGGSKSLESSVLTESEEEGGKGKKGASAPGQGGKGQHDTNVQQGDGKGGPSADSDAQGPRAGSSSSRGGKPVWAQEGIDESVEMGRLNVARAPAKVIDKAAKEALASIATNPALYQLPTLQAVVDAILAGTYVRVDSPLENLGLYKTVLNGGSLGVTTTLSPVQLAAIFLGGAADKTVPINAVTVTNMNTILGITLPAGTDVASLAAAANWVRAAILRAHDQ